VAAARPIDRPASRQRLPLRNTQNCQTRDFHPFLFLQRDGGIPSSGHDGCRAAFYNVMTPSSMLRRDFRALHQRNSISQTSIHG